VVDSRLRKKFQAQPGRQEWITVVECICIDGTTIPPLVIFKGENLMSSWIPREVDGKWFFSCNSKGWTSNFHGEQWVKICFDASTRDKAKGQYRLLLCDGHDSHVSAQFVRYCLNNKIVLFLLLPHSSHILQPLDVGVFGPLKTAMAAQLNRLFAAEIARLHKIEWVDKYIPAREKAITVTNIQGGWRGAGIFPFNSHRVLRTIFESITSSTPSPETIDPFLISSSPPDATTLRTANEAFNDALQDTAVPSPIRMHSRRLSGIAEQLHADNTVLRKENGELKGFLGKRAERQSGKRVVLKGKFVITTELMYKALAEAERKSKKKVTKRKKKVVGAASEEEELEVIEVLEVVEHEERDIEDCITVQGS